MFVVHCSYVYFEGPEPIKGWAGCLLLDIQHLSLFMLAVAIVRILCHQAVIHVLIASLESKGEGEEEEAALSLSRDKPYLPAQSHT